MSFNGISSLVLISFFVAGCSRPDGEVSKLHLSIPMKMKSQSKVGTLGMENLELSHVVINVTSTGMAPVYFNWDLKEMSATWDPENPEPPVTPTSFSISVPRGTGRLVQVAAIYSDLTNQSMHVYYGDRKIDVANAEIGMSIPVAFQTQEVNITGKIIGRYMTSATSGPTGNVDVRYTPVGKPTMVIEKGAIYGGWFSLFAFSELKFDYVITTGPNRGMKMFNQSVSMNSSYFKSSGQYSNRVMKGVRPISSYNPSSSELVEAKQYIWGWFSDGSVGGNAGVSSKYVFADPSLSSLSTNFYVYNASGFLAYSQVADAANFPSSTVLTDTAGSYSNIVSSGGAGSIGGSDDYYDQYFTVDSMSFEWDESAVPFSGPFRFSDLVNHDIVSYNGTGTEFRLLPGTASSIDKIVFYGIPDSVLPGMEDGFACDKVPSNYTKVTHLNPSESQNFSVDLGPLSSEQAPVMEITCSGNPDTLTKDWASAYTFCNNLDYAGHTDWYLPSREEMGLVVIGDMGYNLGKIVPANFSAGNTYWTSTMDSPGYYFPLVNANDMSMSYADSSQYQYRCIRKELRTSN